MRALDRLSLHTRRCVSETNPRGRLARILYIWGPSLAIMAAIFGMSSRSDLGGPDGLADLLRQWALRWPGLTPIIDAVLLVHRYESWVGHFVAYALLALAIVWGLHRQWPTGRRHWIVAWSLALLYGISDEWHQSFVPGRTPDIRDVITDAAGAAVALAIAYYLLRRTGQDANSDQMGRVR